MEMNTISAIPDEIIFEFLTCGVLSSKDVLNFGLTCKRFNMLESTNSVWKELFTLKWPNLLHEKGRFEAGAFISDIGSKCQEKTNEVCEWKIMYYQVNTIFDQLHKVFHDYFSEDKLDDDVFDIFSKLCEQYSFEFVSAVLHDTIVSKSSLVSLTVKYYAKKAFGFIHRQLSKTKLLQLLQMQNEAKEEDELSAFIQGTILIEHCFKPMEEIPLSIISDFIKDAVNETWKRFNYFDADDDHDPVEIAYLKYYSLNYVFFGKLKFAVDYFECSIHQMLETRKGISMFLLIIYYEIATKVGLHLHCINISGHFVLGWQVEELDSTKQSTTDDIAKSYQYIDVKNQANLLDYDQLQRDYDDVDSDDSENTENEVKMQKATLSDVLKEVARQFNSCLIFFSDPQDNVRRTLNIMDLLLLFEPSNLSIRARRIKLNLEHNINLATVRDDNQIIPKDKRISCCIASAEFIAKSVEDRMKAKEMKRRNYKPTVTPIGPNCYPVGMVVQHVAGGITGVVRGWDAECMLPRDQMVERRFRRLLRGTDQPFYHVLISGEKTEKYMAEDWLKMVYEKEELDHPEIGRYFSSTSDHPYRYYVPNSELALRYPEDTSDVIKEMYEKQEMDFV